VADGDHFEEVAAHQPTVDGGEEDERADCGEHQQYVDRRECEVPQDDAQGGRKREQPRLGHRHTAMRHRVRVVAVFHGIDDTIEKQAHDAGGDAGEQEPAGNDDDG